MALSALRLFPARDPVDSFFYYQDPPRGATPRRRDDPDGDPRRAPRSRRQCLEGLLDAAAVRARLVRGGPGRARHVLQPLLGALVRHLPLPEEWSEDAPWTRVLCPGSGLGRLPFEASAMGYAAEGNEFSYHMILANQWILNLTAGPLESTSSTPSSSASPAGGAAPTTCARCGSRTSAPPTCSPRTTASPWPPASSWRCTERRRASGTPCSRRSSSTRRRTSSSTDIRTIAAIIRPGGLWANVGPLLWHYADVADEVSIEVSWEEVSPAICRYFDIREERRCLSYYTSQPGSLKRTSTAYNCIFFAAIRNVTPVEGRSNPVY
ncbi:unnamed protein product [Prorocentrum cordatum]|uniref:Carnosine N-methyltransferase n=1 Tax=Prorocentrum cordatum TaxID=2364126 RepID=A0ABN9WEU3_9DINO|nr:unnamed protein product [Polarella glacialis]